MGYIDDISQVANQLLPWEKLSDCSILITGASGLIGSTLIDVLMARPNINFQLYAGVRNLEKAGQQFFSYMKNENFHIICCDVSKPIKNDIDFHYIIHAASGATPNEFTKHPVDVMEANFLGVKFLLDYGRRHSLKRFLYISSGEIYGEGDGRSFSEEYSGYVNPMLPRSCYPSSKRAAETLCSCYSVEYSVDFVVARPCHVFGPNFTDNDNRVFAQFIRNAINGENILMKSSGEQFRSWCYSTDCASALLYILLNGKSGEAYNIADESSNVTIRYLAETIASLCGVKVVIEKASELEKFGFNPVQRSVFSTSKISSLGWCPMCSLEQNLKHTINHLKERRK